MYITYNKKGTLLHLGMGEVFLIRLLMKNEHLFQILIFRCWTVCMHFETFCIYVYVQRAFLKINSYNLS